MTVTFHNVVAHFFFPTLFSYLAWCIHYSLHVSRLKIGLLLGIIFSLSLWFTKITNVGLEHLESLTNLKEHYLHETQITNAGLLHLQRLNNLEGLYLLKTPISDAGLEGLQKALPNYLILHD